jgi:hypothetical protein
MTIRGLLGRRPPRINFLGQPEASYLYCGICGESIYVTLAEGPFDPDLCEAACQWHLEGAHPLRYKVWRKMHWRWLVAGLVP